MKKIALIVGSIFLAIIFIAASEKESEITVKSLQGVWELDYQLLYDNAGKADTLYNLAGYRQVKVYSKGKVMWTRYNPDDSNEWFGYGTYQIKDGYLEEQLEYASNAMMKIVDTVQVFRFQLEMGKKSYTQIALDDEGNPEDGEHYVKIE